MSQLKQNKKNLFLLSIVILFSFVSVIPLFHHGFFVSDDGDWMIIRFSAFHQAFAHGQFPVRFLPRLNFEYGYAVTNFLYPGFMYLAEPIHLLKFGFVDTIKCMLGLSMIGSGIFSYLWLTKVFNKMSGIAGAFVYLYAAYHFYDIYQRGSVGEVLALAVAPFIFWSIERHSIILSAFGIGLLIISHNILAVLFLPILFMYALFRSEMEFYVPTFLLGAGLTTFFWIPALYDLQYTVFLKTNVSDWQQYFDTVPLIGYTNIFLFLAVLVSCIFKKSTSLEQEGIHRKRLFYLFLSSSLFSLFFSSSLSRLLWQFLPISFIQFPFRLLSISILSASFLSAYLLFVLKKRNIKIGLVVLLILFTMIDIYPYFKSIKYTDKGEGFYATNEDTTTVKNEYMPKWVKISPSERPTTIVEAKDVTISNIVNKTNRISFSTTEKKSTHVTINIIYFPGWQATIDNRSVPILYNNPRGLISFFLPKGNHQVILKFVETPLRLFSDMISVISIFILLFSLIPFPFRRHFEGR